jgi:hypothetical protein
MLAYIGTPLHGMVHVHFMFYCYSYAMLLTFSTAETIKTVEAIVEKSTAISCRLMYHPMKNIQLLGVQRLALFNVLSNKEHSTVNNIAASTV